MNMKHSLLALALGLALSGAAAAAMSAREAEDMLERNGFTEVSPLEYHDGMWRGTAVNTDGEMVDVRIDPIDREVTWTGNQGTRTITTTTTTTRQPVRVARAETPVVIEEIPVVRRPIMVEKRVLVPVGGRLDRGDVRTVLAANGYHDIHDVEWLGGRQVWKAEARDPSGDDLEVHVDPIDGRILHVEDD